LFKWGFTILFHLWIYCTLISLVPSIILPTSSHPHYSTAFSAFSYAFFLNWCNVFKYYSLSISFPLKQSHYCKYIYGKCIYTHMYVYVIMFVFVYLFIFWIYQPHMKENIQLLCFWTWLTSLNIMISTSIHLPANNIISFLFMAQWYNNVIYISHLYIYITFSLSIHQL
jgi:hypothetical protein